MTRLSVVHKTYLAFCAVLTLLLVLVGFAYTSFAELASANRWTTHTYRVLERSEALLAATSRLHAAYRGYVLSGDPHFRSAVLEARREWMEQLGELDRLTTDSPTQRQRLRQVRAAGLAWLEGHIAPGLDSPAPRPVAGGIRADSLAGGRVWRGQAHVDGILRTVRKFASIERQLLTARTYQVERLERRTALILLLGAVCAIGFTALLATLAARRSRSLLAANQRLVREVEQKERAESARRQLSRRYESILNAAGNGIFGVDPDGVITFANPAAARLTGFTAEELVGQPHTLLQPPPAPGAAASSPVWEVLREGRPRVSEDGVSRRRDGSVFPVEQIFAPIVDEGTVVGAVVSFRDATGRREMERIKDEFISVVSHELRTPLTSIHGALNLLASGVMGEVPEAGRRMLEIATQNSQRLVRLINDILDLERINAGRSGLEVADCDAGTLVEQAAEVMHALAERERVRVRVVANRAPLRADPDRLVQVLTNLLSNAIKFSPPESEVELAAAWTDGEVRFTVRDRGRGIPPEHLEEIFRRFQQVDASDAREKGGSGLGLAIARGIVEQHGGRIWAESALGQGSTFTVAIPVAAGPAHAPVDAPRAAPGAPGPLPVPTPAP